MFEEKFAKLKNLLEKLPEDFEINLPGFTFKPKDVISKNEFLQEVFLPSENVFSNTIARNFLYLFDGEFSDYQKLLSPDFRKLFFKVYNIQRREKKGNAIAIFGSQGVGKSFNTLLLSLKLIKEENRVVYYCPDVKNSALTQQFIRKISKCCDEKFVFIIDNCHSDPAKTKDIIQWGCAEGLHNSTPHFLFISRPLENELLQEIYGAETPLIFFKREFIDFDFLIKMYFIKIHKPEKAEPFLESIKNTSLDSLWYNYRNMAFWNEVMLSCSESNESTYTEMVFLKKAHSFLRRNEPYYFECPADFSPLLAITSYDIPIHNEYLTKTLNLPIDVINTLTKKMIFGIRENDWVGFDYKNSVGLFYSPEIHPTKADIILKLYQVFYGINHNKHELFSRYAKVNYRNMSSFLFSITEKKEMNELYENEEMVEATKEYIKNRFLGKELDRAINRLSSLKHDQLCKVFDDEIMIDLIEKINSPKNHITGKLYILRALTRVIPEKSLVLFCAYDEDISIKDFLVNDNETGITSFSKLMEIIKNIYYFAPNYVLKDEIVNSMKRCIDLCAIEFVRRFENIHDYFTQFHWLLKRLEPMKLNNYFLGKIPIAKVIKILKEKDINCVELGRSLLVTCQWTNVYNPDGSKVNYYIFIKNKLTYEDIKKIFENKRSSLFSIVRNAGFDFIAKYLVQFSYEESFTKKVIEESKGKVLLCLKYIDSNYFLDSDEKLLISRSIKKNRTDL